MTQARVTQVSLDVLVLPNPAARLTQLSAEVLVAPPNPVARLTQVSLDVLITRVPVADECAVAWTFPTINPYPVIINGGPQWRRFEEITPDWRTAGNDFYDGARKRTTLLTGRIRRWTIEYDSLDRAEAAILDAHHQSTRGAIGFTLQEPRTGETLTNVRYEKYEHGGHEKTWAQRRSVTLIRYPG